MVFICPFSKYLREKYEVDTYGTLDVLFNDMEQSLICDFMQELLELYDDINKT